MVANQKHLNEIECLHHLKEKYFDFKIFDNDLFDLDFVSIANWFVNYGKKHSEYENALIFSADFIKLDHVLSLSIHPKDFFICIPDDYITLFMDWIPKDFLELPNFHHILLFEDEINKFKWIYNNKIFTMQMVEICFEYAIERNAKKIVQFLMNHVDICKFKKSVLRMLIDCDNNTYLNFFVKCASQEQKNEAIFACIINHKQTMLWFLLPYVDLVAKHNGFNIMQIASYEGNIELVQYLKSFQNIHEREKISQHSNLEIAIIQGHSHFLKWWISNISSDLSQHEHAIFMALKFGYLDIFEFLLNHHAPLNLKDIFKIIGNNLEKEYILKFISKSCIYNTVQNITTKTTTWNAVWNRNDTNLKYSKMTMALLKRYLLTKISIFEHSNLDILICDYLE